MTHTYYPQTIVKHEIQAFKRKPGNLFELRKTHVAFSGSLRRHRTDPEKIILVADPFSAETLYYEFHSKNIAYAEELPSIVDLDGQTVPMARIWVIKGSVGVRCTPFWVEDTSGRKGQEKQ